MPQTTALAAVAETTAERYGGADRYETSVLVAEAYLEEIRDNPDRFRTKTAIVVSGEDRHAAYAMPAAGLASAFDAPILLTAPHRLHPSVAGFLDANDVDQVLVVGGTGVVSAAVESELLQRADSVRRLWGQDQYATSVAVAAAVGPIPGSAGEWGSRGRTALLANGETVADALVAGPLSYHGAHPLLLTPAGALDGNVSAYLDRSDVDHVVILGGTAAVSEAVAKAVQAKGIVVSRLAGADRIGTAAVLARELLGSRRPDPCFNGAVIGLAVGSRAPDALSSGPLLGERCAPLLLSEPRFVPRALVEFLTGDVLLGDAENRLGMTVFGGRAAISDAAVTTARGLALRGEAFSATVDASEGSKLFRVTFNEDVKETDEDGTERAIDPVHYTVNNQALDGPRTDPSTTGRAFADISLSGRTVTVELVEPLAAGDTITVIGETNTPEGRSQIAVDDTLPALETVFYRVPSAPVVTDSVGPGIQIVAVQGQEQFVVTVEERSLRIGDRLRNDVTVNGRPVHEVTVVNKDGNPKAVSFLTAADDCSIGKEISDRRASPPPSTGGDIGVACYEDPATHGARLRYTANVREDTNGNGVLDSGETTPSPLEEGDVITVAKGALADRRGNPNRLTRYTVAPPADNVEHGDFRVSRAAVGDVRHVQQASLLISDAPAEGNRRLRITARSTGAAAGAAGNGWRVYPFVDVDPSHVDPAEWVTDVGVDPVHRIISYTIIDRYVTLADLAAAMNADATFRQHFTARVSRSLTSDLPIDSTAGAVMSGGQSKVGLRVQFTDNVKSVDGLSPVDSPSTRSNFSAPPAFASLFLRDGHSASDQRMTVSCLRRGTVVYLEYEVGNVDGQPLSNIDALLPRPGTSIRMPAGVAESYAEVSNLSEPFFNLRSDPSIPAAFGYPDSRLADASGLHCGGPS